MTYVPMSRTSLPLSTDSEEPILGWSKFPREIYVTDSFAPPFTSEGKQCER